MAETATKKTKLNIFQKMNAVTSAVERIPKRGHNKFHNYDYILEADIVDGVRQPLLDNGLTIIPSVVERETERMKTADGDGRVKEYNIRRVLVEFTIVDDDDPTVTIQSRWWGEGIDALDKGFYKAYTGAQKYFFTKTFHIPTGDDPEGNDGNAAEAAPPPYQSAESSPEPERKRTPGGASEKSYRYAQVLFVERGIARKGPKDETEEAHAARRDDNLMAVRSWLDENGYEYNDVTDDPLYLYNQDTVSKIIETLKAEIEELKEDGVGDDAE